MFTQGQMLGVSAPSFSQGYGQSVNGFLQGGQAGFYSQAPTTGSFYNQIPTVTAQAPYYGQSAPSPQPYYGQTTLTTGQVGVWPQPVVSSPSPSFFQGAVPSSETVTGGLNYWGSPTPSPTATMGSTTVTGAPYWGWGAPAPATALPPRQYGWGPAIQPQNEGLPSTTSTGLWEAAVDRGLPPQNSAAPAPDAAAAPADAPAADPAPKKDGKPSEQIAREFNKQILGQSFVKGPCISCDDAKKFTELFGTDPKVAAYIARIAEHPTFEWMGGEEDFDLFD